MTYRTGSKLWKHQKTVGAITWSTSTSPSTHQQTNHSLTSQPTRIISAEIVQNRSNFLMCSGPFQDSCTQYQAKLVEVLDKWTWTWIGWHSHKRCFHVALLVKHACFKNMTQMGRWFLFFYFSLMAYLLPIVIRAYLARAFPNTTHKSFLSANWPSGFEWAQPFSKRRVRVLNHCVQQHHSTLQLGSTCWNLQPLQPGQSLLVVTGLYIS